MPIAKVIPHDFVLEALHSAGPYTKPMFGCTGVYVEDKIVFILREKDAPLKDNGVWVATTGEHHASLQSEFPIMRSIELFGPGPTGWQVLPSDSSDFEDSVLRACELVLRGDVRIGKVPKSRLAAGATRKKSNATSVKKSVMKKRAAPKKKPMSKSSKKKIHPKKKPKYKK